MKTNDETMLMSSRQVVDTQNKKENAPAKNGNYAWKKVVFGGTAGILVGAGAMYAASVLGAEDGSETEAKADSQQPEDVKVAKVSDDQSFTDAFNSARAEVGPGGVFRWHGGLYSTYNEDEWNNLSDGDKAEFAQAIHPEVSADEIAAERMSEEHPDVVQPQTASHDIQESTADTASDDVQVASPSSASNDMAINAVDQQAQDSNDGDVHVVGQGYVEGHQAVAIDMTGNGEADVAVIDVNDTGQLDGPDVVVDREGNYATMGDLAQSQDVQDVQDVSDGYDYASDAADPNTDPSMQQTGYENPGLSPDMPDYMDDADVSGQFV